MNVSRSSPHPRPVRPRLARRALRAGALAVAIVAVPVAGAAVVGAIAAAVPPIPTRVVALDPSGRAADLALDVVVRPDALGGAVAHRLVLSNRGASAIDLGGARLVVDDRFAAPLADLLVHRGFVEGCRPAGAVDLAPGDRIELILSHDVPNAWRLRDAAGRPLPETAAIGQVTLERAGARPISWRIEPL